MNTKKTAALMMMLLMLFNSLAPLSIAQESIAETEDKRIIRNDDFEGYEIGAIYNGTSFCPINPENEENKEKGVPSRDGSYWFRDNATEEGKGGFTTELSRGVKSNLVSVSGRNGGFTQALQILRPEKVNMTVASLQLYPAGISFNTTRYIYSADIKNGGKCGKKGDVGYTPRVNNGYNAAKFSNVTFNFSDKSIIFEEDLSAMPPTNGITKAKWALPNVGDWFNVKIDIDVLKSEISVYIDDVFAGSRVYGEKYLSMNAANPKWSLVGGNGENVIYFDNINLSVSDISPEELARKNADAAFSKLGNSMVMYVGSPTVYKGEKILKADEHDLSVTPLEKDGKALVPMRFTAENFGYNVNWDENTNSTKVFGSNLELIVKTGDKTILVNGEQYELSAKTELINGRLYFPVEDISKLLEKPFFKDETGLLILCETLENMPDSKKDAKSLSTIIDLYPEAGLGFEVKNIWKTEEDLIAKANVPLEYLEVSFSAWNGITSYDKLAGGLKLSTEHVMGGKYSGKWADHHFYPTLMTNSVPKDWTRYNSISFWIYSELNTNQTITVGALSNIEKELESGDLTSNILYYNIKIDFTGWKQFVIPLELFAECGKTQGFGKVDGLYFYTKAFDYEPNPYTVIYLDNIKLEKVAEEEYSRILKELKTVAEEEVKSQPRDYITACPEGYEDISLTDYLQFVDNKRQIYENSSQKDALVNKNLEILKKYGINEDKYEYKDLVESATVKTVSETLPFEKFDFNHNYPEYIKQIESGGPVLKQPYFKSERAVYGYYPKFMPSYTTAYNGNKYVLFGNIGIQTAGENGKWYFHDIRLQIDKYCTEELNLVSNKVRDDGFYMETKIRFDKDGDAYMLIMVQGSTANGENVMKNLLAHSNDNLKTWKFYSLSRFMAHFENLDTFNTDCLDGPPVILLHNYWVNYNDQSGAFVIPEKQQDGTLVIPDEVIYAPNTICPAQHSGKGNFCVTAKDKVYITYGAMCPRGTGEQYIPSDADIWTLPSFTSGGITYQHKDGVPSYVIEYDKKTKTLSEPVYIGSAGKHSDDNHNWSAIVVDKEGYFHVILIGHHDPLYYVKSKRPYDISEWEYPEIFTKGVSYATFNMDKDGTLYSFTRNSQRGYAFDLTMHRKKLGGSWEDIIIVKNWRSYYDLWHQEAAVDKDTGRLYLTYKSKSATIQIFRDEWYARAFIWPDQSTVKPNAYSQLLPLGTARYPGTRNYATTGATLPAEHVTLISDDGGSNWRLATTEDYIPEQGDK